MSAKTALTNTFVKTLPKNIFSGFVVSLIALPLGLGLALASEAPPISGIIAAVVGGIVVSIFGGSHVTVTGPGNGMVIVLLGAITTLGGGDMYQGYLYTLAAIVVSGVLQIVLGFLKMGKLADFFPASAIEGMLAASAWHPFQTISYNDREQRYPWKYRIPLKKYSERYLFAFPKHGSQ